MSLVTSQQWQSLLHLKSADFKNPDKVDWSIVSALDHFATGLGAKPIIISDYRPLDQNRPSRHSTGKAVDTVWVGVAPDKLYNAARAFPEFDGVGIYVNELGGVSLHVDTTGVATTWGGQITHPVDPDTGKHVEQIAYTTAAAVLSLIKKNATVIGGGGLMLLGLVLLLLLLRK